MKDVIHMSKMQLPFPEADDKKAYQNSFNYVQVLLFF